MTRTLLLACAIAVPALSQPVVSTPTSPDPTLDLGREIMSLTVADGRFAFQQMLSGEVGVIATGSRATGILRTIAATYRVTPLDLYVAAGGSRSAAPVALVNDDRQRRSTAGPSATLPALSSIAPTASLASSGGLGTLAGSACIGGSLDPYDYFQFVWDSVWTLPNSAVLMKNIGAHHQQGIGTWPGGDANLNLGATTAGVAIVCFPPNSATADFVQVQESLGGGLWAVLWSSPFLLNGSGYGIWFKSPFVRKVRVLVRGADEFYWAGAY